jgi:hypothetical protein
MMYLVRNVFHANPGKAKALVEVFKKASPHMESTGLTKSTRILTDTSATFWTVIIESEVEDLNKYVDMAQVVSSNPELGEAMKGYTDLVTHGHREIFRIE